MGRNQYQGLIQLEESKLRKRTSNRDRRITVTYFEYGYLAAATCRTGKSQRQFRVYRQPQNGRCTEALVPSELHQGTSVEWLTEFLN